MRVFVPSKTPSGVLQFQKEQVAQSLLYQRPSINTVLKLEKSKLAGAKLQLVYCIQGRKL